MKGKKSQYVLIMISAMILFLMTVSSFFCINDQSKSWIGSYSFEEFAPGSFRKNEFRDYSITIYEDNGLYARIKIDGYKIFERITAKVWTHHDEIWLTFDEYYVDEEGNSSVPEKYKEGYRLIRMKKAGDAIITEWCGIEPLLFGNEEPGEYFTKDKNSWLLAWESFLPRYILYGLILISEMILFLMAVRHFLGLNNQSKSWIGSYSFEESAPPDRNRNYSITIYEDNGLYARIKIDGYKILERMTAKVWTHHDEIWLTFHEYYVDEEGKSSMLEKYGEGYTLVRMRMEGDVLITNWYLIRPLLIENQKPRQYFTKDKKKSKDKSCKSRLKTILLTSLAVVLAAGGGYVAVHAKCRVVVRGDGNCYVEDGLFEKRSAVKSLKVPRGATGIGDEAFNKCWRLGRVSLPEGLTSIGDQAFYECWGLSNVSLPEGLTSIGDEAFYGCSGLSRVNLPEGLTSIGDEAFRWCQSLTSIDLPESVTSIGDEAFHYSGLEMIRMTQKQAKDFRHLIPDGVVIVISY